MYILTTSNGYQSNNIRYLGWQNPAWDESGYFWTEFHTIPEVLHLNTEEHPFLFDSKDNAIKHAEKINLHEYTAKEVDVNLLNSLAPSHPHDSCYKPGIAIEAMNKLMV